MILLSLFGCWVECDGVGCEESYAAARVSILWGKEEFTLDKDLGLNADDLPSVQNTIGERRLYGSVLDSSDWSILSDENTLIIGTPANGRVRQISWKDINESSIQETTLLIQGKALHRNGASMVKSSDQTDKVLIVGAPAATNTEGTRSEGAILFHENLSDEADLIFHGVVNEEALGERLFECGDLDQDGWTDWIAGVSKRDSSPGSAENKNYAGGVYWGFSLNWRTLKGLHEVSELPATIGRTVGGRFGYSVSCKDDLNGDAQIDAIIGEPFADDQEEGAGAIHVFTNFESGKTPTLDGARHRLAGLEENAWLGWSTGSGDMDGDGLAEIIGGAPGAQEAQGEAYIWLGEELNTAEEILPRFRLQGEDPQDSFGRSTAIADHNGDGYNDSIVGAPRHNPEGKTTGYDAGAIYIFHGGSGFEGWNPIRNARTADKVYLGQEQYLRTGQFLITQDLDSDGTADLILLQRLRN